MGYYTEYTLETEEPELEEEIAEAIAAESGYNVNIFQTCDYYKWYDHEEDMIKVSRKFPEVVFVLSGKGEDQNDLWKKRFVDGQVDEVRAEISYPDFPPLTYDT